MAVLPQLPTYYYHNNFLHLVEQVARLYRDLMTDAESNFIDDFLNLPANAQQLYIRLLCRKGELFRFDKLKYAEIENIDQAAETLCQQQFSCWLGSDNSGEFSSDPENILKLFTKTELIRELLATDTELNKSGLTKLSRDELDTYCVDHWQSLSESLLNFPVLAIYGELEFTTLRLLYFGNLYQDFTDFVLRDLGIYQYENYQIDLSSRGFYCREQIETHLQYYQLLELLSDLKAYDAEELQSLEQRLSDLFVVAQDLDDKRLMRKADARRVELARQLERLGQDQSALDIYAQCEQHPARERQCRIYFNHKDFNACADLCLTIWQQPYNERERQFVLAFVPRLIRAMQKQQGESSERLLSQCLEIKEQKVVINDIHLRASRGQSWLEQGVEFVALKALKEDRQQHGQPGSGFYVENSLINSVFGLFYWELVFAEVAGVFYHGFQHKPDDLYEADFLDKRRPQFEQLNQLLESENNKTDFKIKVHKTIKEKFAVANPFVFWNLMDENYLSLLNKALEAIPLADWKKLFLYIWSDIKNHRSGLPDLIWFSDQGGYELIEVKGPGDTLQKNQLAWLEYFSRNQIPASVLYLKAE